MNSYIQLQAGLLAYYGSVLDNDWHQHNALQIIWPDLECCVEISGAIAIDQQAVVINSAVKHKLTMVKGWILLIEPQSSIGEALLKIIQQKPHHEIVNLEAFQQQNSDLDIDQLAGLWQALNIDCELLNGNPRLDPRILSLQQKLNTCLAGECIKPDHWRASTIADELNLSESRFLHLFKAEMNIAWRPYLLWRRLLCAINSLQRGLSATEAAHVAGFSDSAHLSRTFRNNFGMTIRQVTKKDWPDNN